MDLFEDIFQKLCDLQKSYVDLSEQNIVFAHENNILKQENIKFKTKEEDYIKHIKDLCNTIHDLETERLEWRKVSCIVNLEKQNTLLRNEIETLLSKHYLEDSISKSNSNIEILPEKTIKGIKYYINSNQELFTKNLDESIGNKVGYLQKKDGKTIVTWL